MLRERPSNLDYHKPRAVGVQKSTQVHRYLDHHSEDEVDAVANKLLYEAAQRRNHVSFSAAAFHSETGSRCAYNHVTACMPQHAEAVVVAQFLRVLFLLSTTLRCKYGVYSQTAATAYLARSPRRCRSVHAVRTMTNESCDVLALIKYIANF